MVPVAPVLCKVRLTHLDAIKESLFEASLDYPVEIVCNLLIMHAFRTEGLTSVIGFLQAVDAGALELPPPGFEG